jgi:hypothetical protein
MSEKNESKIFQAFDKIGFFNPFWLKNNAHLPIEPSYPAILKRRLLAATLMIDPVGILEIISRGFCFADRTLVRGVSVSPWFARPNESGHDWEYVQPPDHGSRRIGPEEFADRLFELLKKEILSYCENRATIGVLLSGGMDSRVCAMALYSLIKEGSLNSNVVAITWGLPGSRDVVYAKEIAKRLKWEWVHLPISPENLYENIEITAEQGCLYPPIHLHAIPRVKDVPGLDCVLVSSFGDSMGRAVYSSRHVLELTPIRRYLRNWFGLMDTAVYKRARQEAEADLTRYRMLFPRTAEYAYLEVERQAHYMRRMLNPTIKYINGFISTFQVFTSRDILKFVWSVDPSCRNDGAYRALVRDQMALLADIPWSKTGRPFKNTVGTHDTHAEDFHLYGRWIRNDLNNYIRSLCLSEHIEKLNVFNMANLKRCLDFNRKSTRERVTHFDTIAIWIASLAKMIQLYGIRGLDREEKAFSIGNVLDNVRPLMELFLFEKAMDIRKRAR